MHSLTRRDFMGLVAIGSAAVVGLKLPKAQPDLFKTSVVSGTEHYHSTTRMWFTRQYLEQSNMTKDDFLGMVRSLYPKAKRVNTHWDFEKDLFICEIM